MNEISYFSSFYSEPETRLLLPTLLSIQHDVAIQQHVDLCRYWLKRDKTKYDEHKKRLASFTTSGVFHLKRTLQNLEKYTRNVIIDYDHIPNNLIPHYKERISKIDCVFTCFISPSGLGLKVIIKTTNNQHLQHTVAVQQCWDKLKSSGIDLSPDISGKDVARLCFMSYDENIYINTNACDLAIIEDQSSKGFKPKRVFPKNHKPALESVENYTNRVLQCVVGNRNNYVFRFALNAKQQFVAIDETIQFLLKHEADDFTQLEITKTIISAYNTYER